MIREQLHLEQEQHSGSATIASPGGGAGRPGTHVACKRPDITFLISTYNRAAIVETCVRNLLTAKTPYSFEVIVRDNGSEDNTREVIQSIKDPRLKFIRSEINQGTISFLEIGRHGSGEIMTWLSDEDDFEFQHLDYVMKTFRNDPSCSVLVGSITVGPHQTEVIFPEKVFLNPVEAVFSAMQFSGCGGVFVSGDVYRTNSKKVHMASQQEAYRAWNYYPIGFLALTCLEHRMIHTSRIVVRQMRQAPSANNWAAIASRPKARRFRHYYPQSIVDRLCTNLVNMSINRTLGPQDKWELSLKLTQGFKNQISVVMHPGLIKLLHDNNPKEVVEAYERCIRGMRLHVPRIRNWWVRMKLVSMPIRFIALCWRRKVHPILPT